MKANKIIAVVALAALSAVGISAAITPSKYITPSEPEIGEVWRIDGDFSDGHTLDIVILDKDASFVKYTYIEACDWDKDGLAMPISKVKNSRYKVESQSAMKCAGMKGSK